MYCPFDQKLKSVLKTLSPSVAQMGALSFDVPMRKPLPLRLHLNENPQPIPDEILEDAHAAINAINLYPEVDGLALREVAAEEYGLTKDCVIAANGSCEILNLLHRAFLSNGDTAGMLAPGFTMNRKFAQLQGASLVEIPLNEDYSFPFEKLIEVSHHSKFIVFANPNNPTGTFVSIDEISRFLEETSCLVIVDEAYIDFASESALPLLSKYPHLFVLRSLSKGYSMAGLRVGLGFGHPDIVRHLRIIQTEFNVNMPGQKLAISLLKHRAAFSNSIRMIQTQRDHLFQILKKQNFFPVPSHANFIFARVPEGTKGAFWKEALLQRSILIAAFNEPALQDYLRISVGTEDQMAHVDAALSEIAAENITTKKEIPCT